MKIININQYVELENGFIADLGKNIRLELNDYEYDLFLVSDLDRDYDNEDIKYIPAKVLYCDYKEFTYQIIKTNFILKRTVV